GVSRIAAFFDLDSEARMRSEMNFDMQTPMSGATSYCNRSPAATPKWVRSRMFSGRADALSSAHERAMKHARCALRAQAANRRGHVTDGHGAPRRVRLVQPRAVPNVIVDEHRVAGAGRNLDHLGLVAAPRDHVLGHDAAERRRQPGGV